MGIADRVRRWWAGWVRPVRALPAEDEAWQAVFAEAAGVVQGLAEAARGAKAQRMAGESLQSQLSVAFRQYRQVATGYLRLLEEMLDASELAEQTAGADPRVETLAGRLRSALEREGVSAWLPAVGEPVPAACDVLALVTTPNGVAGSVVSVVRPGYRLADGRVLRRAQVTAGTATATAPEVPVDDRSVAAAEASSAPAAAEPVSQPSLEDTSEAKETADA